MRVTGVHHVDWEGMSQLVRFKFENDASPMAVGAYISSSPARRTSGVSSLASAAAVACLLCLSSCTGEPADADDELDEPVTEFQEPEPAAFAANMSLGWHVDGEADIERLVEWLDGVYPLALDLYVSPTFASESENRDQIEARLERVGYDCPEWQIHPWSPTADNITLARFLQGGERFLVADSAKGAEDAAWVLSSNGIASIWGHAQFSWWCYISGAAVEKAQTVVRELVLPAHPDEVWLIH
jgi:hypothetical protein